MNYLTLHASEAEKFNGFEHANLHADERLKPEKITEYEYGLRTPNGDWLSNLKFYIFLKRYTRHLLYALMEDYRSSQIHGYAHDVNINYPTVREARGGQPLA